MTDNKVLSTDEVDALLNAAKDAPVDLSAMMAAAAATTEGVGLNMQFISVVAESTREQFEKRYSAFMKKKVSVLIKHPSFLSIGDYLQSLENAKNVYSVFSLNQTHYGVAVVSNILLNCGINLLFGGELKPEELSVESSGKVGCLIAEKFSEICLEAFAHTCREYGSLTYKILKTTLLPRQTTQLSEDDQVCMFDFTVYIDEIDTNIKLILPEEFLKEFIPAESGRKSREKNFWRSAIKTQFVDSEVIVSAALPQSKVPLATFMALKEGDLIPIEDPSLVYVSLNDIKLFRAVSGQANGNRVAQIASEI